MLEPREWERPPSDNPNARPVVLKYWQHEPSQRPEETIWFLPGFQTRGDQYSKFFDHFDAYRVILLEPHEGTHPVKNLEELLNLNKTLYRHLWGEVDLSNVWLMGYSMGAMGAAHMAADASQIPRPLRLTTICSPVPDHGFTMKHYRSQFFKMGTRLQLGADGFAGARFAFKEGLSYARRVLENYEESSRLLRSLNHGGLAQNAITMPTHAISTDSDEFFSRERIEDWYDHICVRVRHSCVSGTHARILYDPKEIATAITTSGRAQRSRAAQARA